MRSGLKFGIMLGALFGFMVTVGLGVSQVAHAFAGPTEHAQAFSVDCGSGTADGGINGPVELAAASSKGHMSLRCDNPSSTVVYLGDRDVRGDGTAGYPICTTAASCSDSVLTVDTRELFCAAASSVTVRCIVLTNSDL